MYRTLVTGLVIGSLALTVLLAWHLVPSQAQPEKQGPRGAQAQAEAPAAELPIAQVVLFSSGVGYFQREGEIQGNARVDLSFPVQDINDLLKSMVLEDKSGRVSAVSYDSQAPVEKTLRSFAINLTDNPSFGQTLNQARGEKVEAVLQASAAAQPANLSGVILGVERKQEAAVGKAPVEVEMLNLWCAEGLRSVRLADVQRVRFLNPVLEAEMKKALDVLALSHDTQKKAVSLNFAGEGKRSVKVGYVVENPIWKTSYRLVLDKKGKPFLQGWAVVENNQDEDWNNVRMALISGRPISFRMDLYQPLFVQRPLVEPELFASLRPPTYNGSLERPKEKEEKKEDMPKDSAPLAPAPAPGPSGGGFPGGAGGTTPAKPEPIDPTRSVHSAAIAEQLGDYFQYAIEHPVTLPRQKSAMLPIINQPVEGTKVSIYNEQTHAKFPLLGLKLKNTTLLHLNQGPVTVFENSSYAGDARILDVQPNEEPLISYAIDLGTEVEPVVHENKDRITKITLNKGLLEATHQVRQTKTYNVKNRSEQDRVLLIEHPYDAQFKLIAPAKATERARDVYRFAVSLPAGKTAKLDVVEERDVLHEVILSNTDEQSMRFFLSQAVISAEDKATLQKGMALKDKWLGARQEIGDRERQLKEIRDDQARLRANLKEVPPTAAAYKRYLEKFDKQETEIEQLMESIKALRAKENQQRAEFEAFWPVPQNHKTAPVPAPEPVP